MLSFSKFVTWAKQQGQAHMLLPAQEITSLVRWALWLQSQGACPHVLELGTFVGLTTASWLSFGLEVTTIERESKYLQVLHDWARKYPDFGNKLNSVVQTIDDYLLQTPEPWQKMGLIFIDADKGGYYRYWQSFRDWHNKHPEWRGWLVFDNMFLGGEMLPLWQEAKVSLRQMSDFNQELPLGEELETKLDSFMMSLAKDLGEEALRLKSKDPVHPSPTVGTKQFQLGKSLESQGRSKRWSQRIKTEFLTIYREALSTAAQVDLLTTSDGMLVVRYI